MEQVGHVACMGEIRNAYKVCQNLKVRNHFKDLVVNGRIIKLILKKQKQDLIT